MRHASEIAAVLEPDLDDDRESLGEAVDLLRRELADLDVDAVAPLSSGNVPAGSKAVELLAVGTLLIQAVLTPEVLASIVATAGAWLGRRSGRTIKMTLDGDTLELTGTSSEEQQRMVELWIDRHGSG